MGATPRSTRREFLRGKSAADALDQIVDRAQLPEPLPDLAGEHYLVQLARRAMACQFEVIFNAGQYTNDSAAGMAALDLVDRLEEQLSVYRPTSEISFINRLASEQPVAVDERLFDLLRLAMDIHARTAGAYDITSGPLSNLWGFTRRAGAIPTAEAIEAARQSVGSQFVELDPAAHSVHFTKPGVEINLGSIGKGYTLDRCGELLAAEGIGDFLLHGGNSSVLARGASGRGSREEGWLVGVRNPLRPERRLGQLRLRNQALATSGSGTQFFLHEGTRYGHILDPRTGWPAQGVLSVSVVAPTAAEADALSTAFYVMGPEAATRYCDAHGEAAAVMFCRGAREGALLTRLIGPIGPQWIPLEES